MQCQKSKSCCFCPLVELRAGGRAVDFGGSNVYQGVPKFEIKLKSRCHQKSKLVDWGAKHVDWGTRPSLLEGRWSSAAIFFFLRATQD